MVQGEAWEAGELPPGQAGKRTIRAEVSRTFNIFEAGSLVVGTWVRVGGGRRPIPGARIWPEKKRVQVTWFSPKSELG